MYLKSKQNDLDKKGFPKGIRLSPAETVLSVVPEGT